VIATSSVGGQDEARPSRRRDADFAERLIFYKPCFGVAT
jgi:hypothetical protein